MKSGRWLATFAIVIALPIGVPVPDATTSVWDKRDAEVQRAQEVIEGTIRNTLPTMNMFYRGLYKKVEALRPNGIAITSEKDMVRFIRLNNRMRAFRQSTIDLSTHLDMLVPHFANAITLEERIKLAKPAEYKKPTGDPQIKELERLRLEASKKFFCLINTMRDADYDCNKL